MISHNKNNARFQKHTASIQKISQLMGHLNIQTEMSFYVKNNYENSIKAVRRLEGLMTNLDSWE